ncbi:MAG TPA: hypothetical protein VK988_19940, partial [Acidimicrobiales bacterium]|nr:hypothetical protein [Acidimicrobiales bacterium]
DHATVDALALRARAVRVAAGEVEADGVAVGAQVAGVGDEVVTTDNDRRLLTSRGAWVRNGDRWVVIERRGDGALVVDHAGGRGRVVLPGSYVAENVSLSYAVTVHKAQGITVDRGVVVLDDNATAELVYVAMTRGRLENQAFVVVEQCADLEHGRHERPSPAEALAAAIGRSGAERSATEVLRGELARSEDLAVLVPQLVEVRRFINQQAGRDRRGDLARLLASKADCEQATSAAVERLNRTEKEVHRATAAVEAGRAELDDLAGRRSVIRRRAHGEALEHAHGTLEARLRWLGSARREADQAMGGLRSAEVRQALVIEHLVEVQVAVARRDLWVAHHPTEVKWEAHLRKRVAARRRDLALAAERDQPAHVVRLVGPPPREAEAREDWLTSAGAVEAYREQWRVAGERIGLEESLHGVQGLEWEGVRLQLAPEPAEVDRLRWQLAAPPGFDHGL